MSEKDLDVIEARRAERKAALEKQRKAQRVIDLEALDTLEIEHGDSNVAAVGVPFTPGMVTMAIVRVPKPAELKRYRSRITPDSKGHMGDMVAAAEEVAAVCRVYPDTEAYEALCEARPGLHVEMGLKALKLGSGREADEGKD